jgi:hypothetical protein
MRFAARGAAVGILCCFSPALGIAADNPAVDKWSFERGQLEARKLLNAWVRAQNGGDFKTYAALYADDFEGVRRSNGSSVKRDKAAWLREAQPAFATSRSVRLHFLEMANDDISFVQVSGSDRSREASARDIHLERVGDRFLIASEDVRSSRLLSTARADPAKGWFRLGDSDDVVIWEGSLPPAWLPRKLRVKRSTEESSASAPPEARAEADLPWKSLPAEFSRFKPQPVRLRLMSARKSGTCDAADPVISKRLPVDASQLQMSDDELARLVMEDQLEVWTLRTLLPECEPPDESWAFARLDDGVEPKIATPRRAQRTLAAKALATFKKLPHWRTISAQGAGPAQTVEFKLPTPAGNLHLVALSVESAKSGCATWALWKLADASAGGTWELLNDPGELTAFYPALATDLDGDGKPELFGSDSSQPLTAEKFALAWSASGLRPADGSEWIPLSRAHCEE